MWGIVFLLLIGACTGAVIYTSLTPEAIKARRENALMCAKDKRISTNPSGLELWAHNHCEGHNSTVYYTVQGAEWATEDCRFVGKIRRCETVKHQSLNGGGESDD
jgi:hypothetical protein